MIISEKHIHNIVDDVLRQVLSEEKVIKIPKHQSSQVPPQQPQPPMEPPMDNNAPMGDAPMDGEAPVDNAPMGDMPQDNGGAPMDNAPMDGGEAPMGDEPPMEGGEEGDDSTMSIINQLSDTDKEAVRAYAKSMLNRDESQNNGEDNGEEEVPPMDASMGQNNDGAPMMECVIFTKKQLRKINENFGPTSDELEKDKKPLEKKKSKQVGLKSPFSAPRFK